MGLAPMKPCSSPGCGGLVRGGGRCPECRARQVRDSDRRRGSSAVRGYGVKWQRIRAQFLRANPACVLCGTASTVADHWPVSRRQLVSDGVTHPDAWSRLRPLCEQCHNRSTAREQPGGWNAPGRDR